MSELLKADVDGLVAAFPYIVEGSVRLEDAHVKLVNIAAGKRKEEAK